jgi:hypothetical protein
VLWANFVVCDVNGECKHEILRPKEQGFEIPMHTNPTLSNFTMGNKNQAKRINEKAVKTSIRPIFDEDGMHAK